MKKNNCICSVSSYRRKEYSESGAEGVGRNIFSVIIFFAVILSLILYSPFLSASEMKTAPEINKPCPECYLMHPEITLFDDNGNRTRDSKAISSVKTCGVCHDAAYINTHNIHFKDKVKAGCIECHVDGSRISPGADSFTSSGTLKKSSIGIHAPKNENCAFCHGIIGAVKIPVSVPDDYQTTLSYKAGGRYYNLTQKTGEIISAQNISESLLNISGKDKLSYPWDTHSQREVYCIACHFTKNDPKKNESKKSDQVYLSNDPRRVYSLSRYLYRPDHTLVAADCRSCHEPEKVHKFLKYKKRHFEVLACQSCHVPKLYGPAMKSVDETVFTGSGTAKIEYRNIDNGSGNLNTAFISGYEPYLLAYSSLKGSESGSLKRSIAPFNLVVYFRWRDSSGNAVSAETLKKIYLDGAVYATDIIRLFDDNKNGSVDEKELVLDSRVKADKIRSKLSALGIDKPEIVPEIVPYRVNHGIGDEKTVSRDCSGCHGGSSRFGDYIRLSGTAVPVTLPSVSKVRDADSDIYLGGRVMPVTEGAVIVRERIVKNHYIFGYSRVGWLNFIGLGLFLFTLFGITGHGALRYLSSSGAVHGEIKTKRIYMYQLYERIWHWTMAFSVIMLIITGLEIHFTGSFNLFGFANSIDIHNAFALIVAANAGLSFFYYAATGKIRQFFMIGKGFGKETIAQGVYYLYGIFKKSAHPVEKTPERRYNPLQQITYVMLLNVLFPFQIVTGIMMWSVSVSPLFAGVVGGLSYIAPLHNFAAWLFITFLVMHLYLITTGHTVLANLKGMITGIEDIDESGISGGAVQDELLKVNLKDIISNIRDIIKRR